MQAAVLESVRVGEHRVGFSRMSHVFLQPEVGYGQVEMQRRRHAYRRQIRRSMATGLDVIEIGELRDSSQVADAARMHDGGANVVDQLLLDQLLAIPNAVEDLPHRKRCRGVLAD